MKIKVNYIEPTEFKNQSDFATYVGACNDILDLLSKDENVSFDAYIKTQEKSK